MFGEKYNDQINFKYFELNCTKLLFIKMCEMLLLWYIGGGFIALMFIVEKKICLNFI